jgi:hypothetical protein
VRTSTTWSTLPEITDPRLVILLETMTAMRVLGATALGGRELLPGRVVQVSPHQGDAMLFSKPLKLAGARPVRR